MFKLIFFAPSGKMASIKCKSLAHAREGIPYLPAGSYFGIANPDGYIIEQAPEFAHQAHIINTINKVYHLSKLLR